MELGERLGPSLDHWLAQPYAFALYTYYVLQDIDRRRAWQKRMQRQTLAELLALAFNQPQKLADERRNAEQAAACKAVDTDAILERARQMFAELDRGKVMEA